jgi:hypothetical protein
VQLFLGEVMCKMENFAVLVPDSDSPQLTCHLHVISVSLPIDWVLPCSTKIPR